MIRLFVLQCVLQCGLGQEEQASLLQLLRRADLTSEQEEKEDDSLDKALGGKGCKTWLAEEATAKAHAELEHYRQEMERLGDEEGQLKETIKIGAYCPQIIKGTALNFTGTPCKNRNGALKHCTKGLSDTCKFMRKALKKMLKKTQDELDKALSAMPPFMRELSKSLSKLASGGVESTLASMNCDAFSRLKVKDLSVDIFENLKVQFEQTVGLLS